MRKPTEPFLPEPIIWVLVATFFQMKRAILLLVGKGLTRLRFIVMLPGLPKRESSISMDIGTTSMNLRLLCRLG